MDSGGISVRRRQLMLAGTASVVAPTVSFAFPASASPVGTETLLVSGRIVDTSGKPVAGALVEMASPAHSATTDGDGRFMLKTRVSRRDEYVDYRFVPRHGCPSQRAPIIPSTLVPVCALIEEQLHGPLVPVY